MGVLNAGGRIRPCSPPIPGGGTRAAGRRVVAALMAGVAMGACESSSAEPLADFELVHSVLVAGSETAQVRMERFEPDQASRFSIDDALVSLRTPEAEVTLSWVPGLPCIDTARLPVTGRTGCYEEALPAAVRSGAEYSLRAELPEGGVVRGWTRVPERPVMTLLEEPWLRYPLPHLYVPVRLRWDAGPAAGRVEARLRFLRARERGGGWHAEDCTVSLGGAFAHDPREGEAEIRIRDIGCDFDWDAMAVEIHAIAYDTAYARYYRLVGPTSLGVDASLASAGLEGALGVFGSAAMSLDTFLVQRESPN